jgi:predicted nucleic acid-binding OB-fold protein
MERRKEKRFSTFGEIKARISVRRSDEHEVELAVPIERDGGNHL